eukprot:GHRQ01006293.1.p1 GENE.GHRQ01006293.1~~GHRQ01006293.1.p1  ORF type:complete len:303 (+),score=132.82 GHRQ01006293.1:72-980(+)
MEGQAPSAAAAAGGQAAKPSLAAWKQGAVQMTMASAGELVAKAAPKQQKTSSNKAPVKRPKVDKPFLEKTKEERFGSKPREVNMSKQVKDVLQFLEAHQARERPITWEEIVSDAIPAWYDTVEGGQLYNVLVGNDRVAASAHGFMYRSEHGIRDKATLLRFLREHPQGVKANEISDGYENVLRDADQLHAEGAAFKLYNAEFKVDVYFAAPEKRTSAPPDMAEVYLKTQLPLDPAELIASLSGLGIRSALASAASSRKPISLVKTERVKKKRKMNIRHMTNVHMADMLTGADAQQYTSIDRR